MSILDRKVFFIKVEGQINWIKKDLEYRRHSRHFFASKLRASVSLGAPVSLDNLFVKSVVMDTDVKNNLILLNKTFQGHDKAQGGVCHVYLSSNTVTKTIKCKKIIVLSRISSNVIRQSIVGR